MTLESLIAVLSFGLTCFIAGVNVGKSANDRPGNDDHS